MIKKNSAFYQRIFWSFNFSTLSIPFSLRRGDCDGREVPFRFYLARQNFKFKFIDFEWKIRKNQKLPLCRFLCHFMWQTGRWRRQKVASERKFWWNYLLGIFSSLQTFFASFPRVSCVGSTDGGKNVQLHMIQVLHAWKMKKRPPRHTNVRWEKREKEREKKKKKKLLNCLKLLSQTLATKKKVLNCSSHREWRKKLVFIIIN